MSSSCLLAIIKQELRILRRDPAPFSVLFVMPALALVLFTPALAAVLREQGNVAATGVELALPGMTVMFGSLGAAFLGFAIFREHQWHTWERLLIGSPSKLSILLGKTVVPFGLIFGQQILLLLFSLIVYDAILPDFTIAYVLTAAAFALNVCAIGIMASMYFHSLQQMNAVIHVGALLLAASCGAFIPLSELPGWGQSLSMLTPGYWMVQSQTQVLLNLADWQTVVESLLALILQATLMLLASMFGFRLDRAKVV